MQLVVMVSSRLHIRPLAYVLDPDVRQGTSLEQSERLAGPAELAFKTAGFEGILRGQGLALVSRHRPSLFPVFQGPCNSGISRF